jgi:hypothetical protein
MYSVANALEKSGVLATQVAPEFGTGQIRRETRREP